MGVSSRVRFTSARWPSLSLSFQSVEWGEQQGVLLGFSSRFNEVMNRKYLTTTQCSNAGHHSYCLEPTTDSSLTYSPLMARLE